MQNVYQTGCFLDAYVISGGLGALYIELWGIQSVNRAGRCSSNRQRRWNVRHVVCPSFYMGGNR